jgi:hypothetical protein
VFVEHVISSRGGRVGVFVGSKGPTRYRSLDATIVGAGVDGGIRSDGEQG